MNQVLEKKCNNVSYTYMGLSIISLLLIPLTIFLYSTNYLSIITLILFVMTQITTSVLCFYKFVKYKEYVRWIDNPIMKKHALSDYEKEFGTIRIKSRHSEFLLKE